MYNIITNTLISKYHLSIKQLKKAIQIAVRYNYASAQKYVEILNKISTDDEKISYSSVIMENSIEFIVIHDQIDKFKEYVSQKCIENDSFILIPDLFHLDNNFLRPDTWLSLIEACAYFGSVNIFYFLISNQNRKITPRCLLCSIIGRNPDIINECLKDNKIDNFCLTIIVRTHNNKMLDYVVQNKDFDLEEWIKYIKNGGYKDIIKCQNLKAVFLLFEQRKDSIFPWCAAFSQTIDIFRNNEFPYQTATGRKNVIHFAIKSQNSDLCKFLLDSSYKDQVNKGDENGMTPLHCAVKLGNKELIQLLLLNGANINEKK